jgi:hypothetical protein
MKKMNSRGQLLSQPFIYISIIIVVGLIVVLGFTQIGNLMCFGSEVENTKFMKDVDNHVQQMYSFSAGSKQKYEMLAPSNIYGVCIVDQNPDLTQIPFQELKDKIAVLSDAGDLDENIFVSGPDGDCLPDPIMIEHLRVQGGTICFNVAKEGFNFVLENKGTHVEISKFLLSLQVQLFYLFSLFLFSSILICRRAGRMFRSLELFLTLCWHWREVIQGQEWLSLPMRRLLLT